MSVEATQETVPGSRRAGAAALIASALHAVVFGAAWMSIWETHSLLPFVLVYGLLGPGLVVQFLTTHRFDLSMVAAPFVLSNACYTAAAFGIGRRPTSPLMWLFVVLIGISTLPFLILLLLGLPGLGGP